MKFWQKNKPTIKFILVAFFIWRIALFLIAYIGSKIIPLQKNFLGESIWANFDGVHYLSIAKHGYFQYQQAFFPLYPYLIRLLTTLTKNYLLSGLFLSHFSFLIALFFFYQLIKIDYPDEVAKKSLIYLFIFPAAFYFASVYTESLFLAFVLVSFYAARKKYWWQAGISGSLASATRLAGVFLFPALLVEWCQQRKTNKSIKNLRSLLPLSLIILGLLVYMVYLQKTVDNPLYFIKVQPYFGAQRTGGKLILLYQVFWRYFKMLAMVEKITLTYFIVVLEFLTGVGFLGLLIWSYFKKIRPSYLVFAGLSFLVPTLTGTFSSLPRYVLVCFPCFLALALIKNRILRFAFCILSFALLTACVILFTRGYWVS